MESSRRIASANKDTISTSKIVKGEPRTGKYRPSSLQDGSLGSSCAIMVASETELNSSQTALGVV